MSNKQSIDIIDNVIKDLEIGYVTSPRKDIVSVVLEMFKSVKNEIQSLPDTDEWISADNQPEEVQMKQILAYEIDERRGIITATFYDGNWLRDDNENICFFDFWKELPTPPIN